MSGCTASSSVRAGRPRKGSRRTGQSSRSHMRAVDAVAGIGVKDQLALHPQLLDHPRGDGPRTARAPAPPTRTPAPPDAPPRGGSARRGWRAGGGRGSRPAQARVAATSSSRSSSAGSSSSSRPPAAWRTRRKPVHMRLSATTAATTGSSQARPVSADEEQADDDPDAGPEVGQHVLAVGDEGERAAYAGRCAPGTGRARG